MNFFSKIKGSVCYEPLSKFLHTIATLSHVLEGRCSSLHRVCIAQMKWFYTQLSLNIGILLFPTCQLFRALLTLQSPVPFYSSNRFVTLFIFIYIITFTMYTALPKSSFIITIEKYLCNSFNTFNTSFPVPPL